MKSSPLALFLTVVLAVITAGRAHANDRVVVVANANEGYTERRFGEGKAAR